MTTCELRLKAATLLEEKGHCKWTLIDRRGAMCLNGALLAAAGADLRSLPLAWPHELTPPVCEALMAMGFPEYPTVEAAEWNNAPERTQDEVIARLKEGCL